MDQTPAVMDKHLEVVQCRQGLWMALRDIFPGTQLKGCGFHWAQAILRKVQDVGLKATYERREGAHILIKKLLALPFLPGAHIRRAFDRLREKGDSGSDQMKTLFQYVEDQWLESSLWSEKEWSVYRQSIRTNNDVEDGGILLGASSLTGRYWYGSLWYYQDPELAPDVEKCTAGVQLESGLNDACWVDETRVLVGMDTGGVALWELTDNLHTFIQQSSATEHDNIVSSVCVCQDKQKVISSSYDKSIKLWNLETFASISKFKAHTDAVYCVRNHPTQADICLTASQDGNIFLWDFRKKKPAARLDKSPLTSIPTCVAWQPGQEHVYAVGSDDGQLVIRDTRAAVTESVSIVPHHRGITRLQFSPYQSNQIASISEDGTVMVVDVASNKPKQLYRSTSHKDFVKGVSWSGESTLLTCGWDAQVCHHTIQSDNVLDNSEDGPTKMEVNGEQGEPAETNVKDTTKSVPKCQENGDRNVDIEVNQEIPT